MISLLALATLSPMPPVNAVIAEQPCNTYSWSGEDDTAHEMLLTNPLTLGNTTYNTTYVTTNGTLTFGTPDANFSSYPNTPSISLAGYDWVTFGEGASLSYGATNTGFCVEWRVRPFPQSGGNLTIIKLTVDTSKLPSWSGVIETTGWLPTDLRRGIRFASGEDVVTISEAFSINGGVPVEMQTCWDGSIIPLSSTCPPEPPPGQCWDGSTIPWNGTCPPIPPDTQCWDGSWVTWSQTCPPTPPDIICWNGETISWNETCPQMPPMVECWDGSEVNWNEQCPPTPPNIICWDDSVIPWNELCPVEPSPTPSPTTSPEPQPSESQTPTLEPSPQPSEPSPQPSQSVEPPLEPSPTPTPSESESEAPEPVVSPTQSPEPEPSSPSEPTPSPEESPSPDPSPSATEIPSNNDIIDAAVEDAVSDGTISDADTQEIIGDLLSDGDISNEELTNLSDSLTSDGVLTQDDKELLADVLVAQADGEAISSEMIDELGLDFEDLPEDQPVALENGVILLADVADALEIFSNPSEILGAVFTDPGKALTAVANIGEDMTDTTRKESQKVVIAAVIAAQILTTASMVGRVR
jgi:hypothetical protein